MDLRGLFLRGRRGGKEGERKGLMGEKERGKGRTRIEREGLI